MKLKGDEHNNLILTLTPTKKVSLKRLFNLTVEKILSESAGFQAYDCATRRMEHVIQCFFIYIFNSNTSGEDPGVLYFGRPSCKK